jgi:hypothetical protein
MPIQCDHRLRRRRLLQRSRRNGRETRRGRAPRTRTAQVCRTVTDRDLDLEAQERMVLAVPEPISMPCAKSARSTMSSCPTSEHSAPPAGISSCTTKALKSVASRWTFCTTACPRQCVRRYSKRPDDHHIAPALAGVIRPNLQTALESLLRPPQHRLQTLDHSAVRPRSAGPHDHQAADRAA